MGKVKIEQLPNIRVSKMLKDETIECAVKSGKNLSEYIRDAVIEMNKKVT